MITNRQRFPVKRINDGRAALNLACGTKTEWQWNNLDFSPYARLRHHPLTVKLLRWGGVISDERYERLVSLDPDIICWNLCRGVPFADGSFDVVYHAHFLEHLERNAALEFMQECYRVLKPGGIIRVVVPDLQLAVMTYAESWKAMDRGEPSALALHRKATFDLLDQMVRTEVSGTAKQKGLIKHVEKLARGDARKTGEVHRWMYDQWSLHQLLETLQLRDIRCETASTSRIAGWEMFRLDIQDDGLPSKPESLYMEAVK
jgi:SAM-dependent methyltransferase